MFAVKKTCLSLERTADGLSQNLRFLNNTDWDCI